MWNGCFCGPTENFRNEHQNKARYRNSTSATCFMKLRLRCLDEMRRVYFTRVSAQLGFVTGIKQQPLPQLVTGHVKMIVFLDPQGTLVTSTKKSPLLWNQYRRRVWWTCASDVSTNGATLWGPLVSTGNGLLWCLLLCWHVCNGCSNWSSLLSDRCL
jgi:hypothetical protein